MSNPAAHALHMERRARFERDFVPLRPMLVQVGMAHTHNWHDAEDLAQDALLRAMREADEGRAARTEPRLRSMRLLFDAISVLWRRQTTTAGGERRRRFVPLDERTTQEVTDAYL